MIKSKDLSESHEVINFFDLAPLPYEKTCITIGNFDGVHLGHQAIIAKMVKQANAQGNPLIVITFFPNPFDFLNPHINSFYLSTPAEKTSQLLALGVDRVLTFEFERDFANLTPREFLSALKKNLGFVTLVVGEDFELGKNRQGTTSVLEKIGEDLSFDLKVLSEVKLGDKEISSTKVRVSLDEGNVREAAALLGRYYGVSGIVTHGSDRGSKIGLPTANIAHWTKKKLPATGVYATLVNLRDNIFQGVTNVGFRPTFEDQELPNIETYIFDFDEDSYGEKMRLEFVEKIREEQKFSGVDALLAQIEHDKVKAQRILQNEQK